MAHFFFFSRRRLHSSCGGLGLWCLHTLMCSPVPGSWPQKVDLAFQDSRRQVWVSSHPGSGWLCCQHTSQITIQNLFHSEIPCLNLHKEQGNHIMKRDFKNRFEKRKRKLTESALFFERVRTQTIRLVGFYIQHNRGCKSLIIGLEKGDVAQEMQHLNNSKLLTAAK